MEWLEIIHTVNELCDSINMHTVKCVRKFKSFDLITTHLRYRICDKHFNHVLSQNLIKSLGSEFQS